MDKFIAGVAGIAVVVGVLVPVGIAVCVLGLVTNGSLLVIVAGAGLGISFACYCGYRAALSVLSNSPQRLPPASHSPDDQDHR